MQETPTTLPPAVRERAEFLYERNRNEIAYETDRLFAGLLAFEWAVGIAVAVMISPRTWAGTTGLIHPHVIAAAVLGGIVVSLPILMAWLRPGQPTTRHTVALAQMFYGALLIHLTGGRIETHFHVFGSLALLAFYRDWRVLLSGSVVVMFDHVVRGLYWPRSVYGVIAVEPWRWVEHVGWVVFEDVFLIRSCFRSVAEMRAIAEREASLEDTRDRIEREVESRTAELRASEAQKAAIFVAALDAIITFDEAGRIVEFNPAAEAMFGHSRAEVQSRPLAELLVLTSDRPAGERFETTARRTDGSEFPVEVAVTAVRCGGCVRFTGFVRDISERRRHEERLKHQATHDALTGLPNRVFLQSRMDEALATSNLVPPTVAALLMVDLDRFKEINDTFGHPFGDLVLQRLVPRLRDAVGSAGVLARIGGDEFGALLVGSNAAMAEGIAEALVREVARPLIVEGRPVDVGASVGIARCPGHAVDPSSLMQCADVAMYAAKKARTGYQTFSSAQSTTNPRRLALTSELRRGIEKDQLQLHYQPKIDLHTGRIDGAEALVRWQHPSEGLVPPGEFIPLAEHAGLMRPMSLWVLRAALAQHQSWRRDGHAVGVSVNLGASDLGDCEFIDMLAEIVEGSKSEHGWLTVEITESAMMADPALARDALERLHGVGARASIDDFGTGYSSLAYLKDLPVDELKIDRSFLKNLTSGGPSLSIVRTIVELGHNLGLEVVAEGVEDSATAELLKGLGCDLTQGFYYSRPLPPDDFLRWLVAQPEPLDLTSRHDRRRPHGRIRRGVDGATPAPHLRNHTVNR